MLVHPLPRFNELAPAFYANGVDAILCVSVNDTFVMNEWAKDQEAANIVMIPDGNADFTEGMGMLVDKADLGFGKRSWRYAMLVKDGVVQKMFIEPQEPGDPFKVSDADTMLNYINPNAKKPDQVVVFTKVAARTAPAPRPCWPKTATTSSKCRWTTRSAARRWARCLAR